MTLCTLWKILLGRGIDRDIERNREAADRLDRALREVTKK